MSLNNQDLFLIEKYLDGELSEEETLLFHSKLKNETFADEVRLQRAAIESVKVLQRNKLKSELKQLLKENADLKSAPGKQRFLFYGIAAAIAMLLIIASYLFTRPNDTPDSLFLSHYRPYPLSGTMRGASTMDPENAFAKYNDGEYEQACIALEELLKKGSDRYKVPMLQLLLGNCYLETNRVDKALDSFGKAKDSDDHFLSAHGAWYYSLTLLKANKIDQAIAELQQLEKTNSIYSKQAKDLEEKLTKL